MSTYHLPGKGIPAVLRRAAGLQRPGGSKAKTIRSLKDGKRTEPPRSPRSAPLTEQVVGLAQVAVKVYRDMLRTEEDPSPPLEPPSDAPPPTEAHRLRQRADNVWLALGIVGRDIITHADTEGAEVLTDEELRRIVLEELGRGILEKLERIIQTLQRWLNLFALFMLRLFFFEFPNNLRHLCTTMPWSIWPALVVLWGVCWMFYDSAESWNESQGTCPCAPYEVRKPDGMEDLEFPQEFTPLPQPSVSPLYLGDPMIDSYFLAGGTNLSMFEPLLMDNYWEYYPMTPTYPPHGQAYSPMWPGPSIRLNTAGFVAAEPLNGGSDALGPFPAEPMVAPMERQTSSSHSASMNLGTRPPSPAVPTRHGNSVGGEPSKLKCDRPSCEGKTFKSASKFK